MSAAEYWQRVVAMAQRDFIALDDGYLRYWPDKIHGALSAADLRIIADELDRRNAPWGCAGAGCFGQAGGRAMSTMEERAWDIASTFAPADQARAELFDAILAALREAKAEGAREMRERCAKVAEVFPSLAKVTSGNAGWADLCQAADLLARVARERDEARAHLEDADRVISRLNSGAELQAIAKAHNEALQRAEAAEKLLRDINDDTAVSWVHEEITAHLAKHAGGNNG